jgi:hypothetical protein
LAGWFAWASSRRFARERSNEVRLTKDTLMAPPAVIWMFAMFLFAALGVLRILAYW